MRMLGVFDELYVRARAALLDTAEAIGAHLDAAVLVGAQAIYLHTGDTDLAIAEYTTDADFAISPIELAGTPLLDDLLEEAGFTLREHPGAWLSPDGIYVDLMVPEALAGPGRRGARLGPHGKRAARRTRGIEGALIDRERHTISALDPADPRQVSMWVAGPAALLVAKIHKIVERVDASDRVRDKDALDVLRLLRAVDTNQLAHRLRSLLDQELTRSVATEAIAVLPQLFGDARSFGVTMAVRAAGVAEDPTTIAGSLIALTADLRSVLE
ncbi:MAG: hypothetical protein M1134_03295 [Actinobacteria bacterium]|nr:hypothetical protein [Actinomycetota bacterium]